MVKVFAVIATVAVALLALDRLALWMESRGWIYWRRRRPERGGATAGLLTEFQKIVEPEVRHVIEAKEGRRLERLNLSAEGPARNNAGNATDERPWTSR